MTNRFEGYQPTDKLDTSIPPIGGSAVPSSRINEKYSLEEIHQYYDKVKSVHISHLLGMADKLIYLESKVKRLEEKIEGL